MRPRPAWRPVAERRAAAQRPATDGYRPARSRPAIALALAVHLALFGLLGASLRWRSRARPGARGVAGAGEVARVEALDVERAAEVVALEAAAAVGDQLRQLLGGLDALGHHLEAAALRH